MNINYKKKLDAIVLSWLEVREQKPIFQKRVYKDMEKVEEYLTAMFASKSDCISNVQMKICYKLNSIDELTE